MTAAEGEILQFRSCELRCGVYTIWVCVRTKLETGFFPNSISNFTFSHVIVCRFHSHSSQRTCSMCRCTSYVCVYYGCKIIIYFGMFDEFEHCTAYCTVSSKCRRSTIMKWYIFRLDATIMQTHSGKFFNWTCIAEFESDSDSSQPISTKQWIRVILIPLRRQIACVQFVSNRLQVYIARSRSPLSVR